MLLVFPRCLIKDALGEAHDSPISGHLGVARTHARLNSHYYFPVMVERVSRYVSSCDNCQRKKDPASKPGGFLQPMCLKGPFARIHMDYCGPFLHSQKRNQYILLAICPLTKYVIMKAVRAATAKAAAKFLVENVVLVHGCFEELATDRGTHFTAAIMKEAVDTL